MGFLCKILSRRAIQEQFNRKQSQSTGISAAVHKPHLYRFSEDDRKKPWYKRRLFRGLLQSRGTRNGRVCTFI